MNLSNAIAGMEAGEIWELNYPTLEKNKYFKFHNKVLYTFDNNCEVWHRYSPGFQIMYDGIWKKLNNTDDLPINIFKPDLVFY